MSYIGLGINEPTNWQQYVGQQFEILFPGRDGKQHKSAGIFTGIINSTKYANKRIVVLQPSADTTNYPTVVPIGINDRTAVYLSDIQTFRQSNYNMSTFPKYGGTSHQPSGSDGNKGTIMPPVEPEAQKAGFSLKWFTTIPGMLVAAGVLAGGAILIKRRGSRKSIEPIKVMK